MFAATKGALGYGSCVGTCAHTKANMYNAGIVINIFFIVLYFSR